MNSQARVLLLGSRGRLGAALTREWATSCALEPASRAEINVANATLLRDFLDSRQYDILVNCTGLTSLEACEDHPSLAHAVNAIAPEIMATHSAQCGAILLHFGTDYVFDGTLHRPYVETDEPAPLSVYGQSKLDGERAVLSASDRHLCIRVSWVFGPDKASFIDQILSRALTDPEVSAVNDKTSCPTYSVDVARWMAPFLKGDLPGGLYHACNRGTCSWLDFAQHGLDLAAALGYPLRTRTVQGIPMHSLQAFRATRPPHTPMDCTKLASTTGITPRSWESALASYLRNHPVRLATCGV